MAVVAYPIVLLWFETSCQIRFYMTSVFKNIDGPAMSITLIAPCGMNCRTCMAYLREKNICFGCRSDWVKTGRYIRKCSIRFCELLEKTDSKFCYECTSFPCKRLKQLDKRYRTKYDVSFIENLAQIQQKGLEEFFASEIKRWHCHTCGGTVCVHRGYCLKCINRTSGPKKRNLKESNP